MNFSSGTGLLLGAACLMGLIAPFIGQRGNSEKAGKPFNSPETAMDALKANWPCLSIALAGSLLLWLSGAAAGIFYFLGALFGSWLMSAFLPQAGLRGILLLIIATLLFGKTGTLSLEYDQTPLIAPFSFLLGLITSCISQHKADHSDYLIPATWLIGHFWIALALPESAQPLQQNLLLALLSITLFLRALDNFQWLPKGRPVLQGLFFIITGGLGAWLAIQNLLFQPALLHWAALYAGGLLLGFLMTWDHPAIKPSNPTVSGLIQLILIGLGALVASRLFGTLGWVVLSAGILAFTRLSGLASLGALFFLCRALLQTFIFQYNPNVTGINITHPYASAALFAGFAFMLALPELFQFFQNEQERGESPTINGILLTLAWLPIGALAVYFLHAEASGSLLTAMTIAGLGIGLLGQRPLYSAARIAPLMFSTVAINGALLTGNTLLDAGNTAEKSQKLLVLAGTFAFYVILFLVAQRKASTSGKKPIEIA